MQEKIIRNTKLYFEDNLLVMKSCTACLEIKKVDEFYKDNSVSCGYSSRCIECTKAGKKNLLDTLYEKAKEAGEDYLPCTSCHKILHIDKFNMNNNHGSKRRKNRQSSCHDCCSLWQKEYRQDNKEFYKEKRKNDYEKNKEKCLRQMKEYHIANKEKIRIYHKEYRQKNKKKISIQRYKYRKNNKEKLILQRANYKRNMDSSTRESEKEYWREYRRFRRIMCPDDFDKGIIYEKFGKNCFLTNETENIHIEHFIPITTGHGDNSFRNCYPLASSLNISKGNKNPFEWIESPFAQEKVDMKQWETLVNKLALYNGLTLDEFKEYVNWCFINKRTDAEEIKNNKDSLLLWKQTKKGDN